MHVRISGFRLGFDVPVEEYSQVTIRLEGVRVVQPESPLIDDQCLLLVIGRLQKIPGVVKDDREEAVGPCREPVVRSGHVGQVQQGLGCRDGCVPKVAGVHGGLCVVQELPGMREAERLALDDWDGGQDVHGGDRESAGKVVGSSTHLQASLKTQVHELVQFRKYRVQALGYDTSLLGKHDFGGHIIVRKARLWGFLV